MNKDEFISWIKEALNDVSDELATSGKELYPLWEDFPDGYTFEVGTRIRHATSGSGVQRIYNVITKHQKQFNWEPGATGLESVYQVIDIEHAGTIDDPIPFVVNMIVYEGKYYIYNNIKYLCIRDSGIALQYTPDQLIDHYFKVAN